VAQKPVESYEFYMTHLVNEADDMEALKGNADDVVAKLMKNE
jgi:hypothetical protein